MYVIQIKCKDEHTFRMLIEYLKKRCTLVGHKAENKIRIYSDDEMESEKIYDNIVYQLDMWKDLKAEVDFI